MVPKPTIEIVLINKRYEEILLSEEFLDIFYSKRQRIMEYFNDEALTLPPLCCNGTSLEFGRVGTKKAVSFKGQEKTIIILRDTCLNLMHLIDSVKNIRRYLLTRLKQVVKRFDQFLTIVKNKPTIAAWNDIKSNTNFDCTCIIDTELLGLCFYEMLNHVQNEASSIQRGN